MGLMSRPDPTSSIKAPGLRIFTLPYQKSLFWLLVSDFSGVFGIILPFLVFFVHYSLLPGILLALVFSVFFKLLDFDYLGNVVEFFQCIFVISAVIMDCFFWKNPFYCYHNAGFSMCTNKIIFFGLLFLANLVGFFCRTMSAGSPQCRARQRTEGDRAALRAKIMDRPVIAERNVIRSDIMVAPLDSIHDTIQTFHWGYLHSCACVVYTRLVRLFYTNLEVVQDDDRGLVLQSTIGEHIITIDP